MLLKADLPYARRELNFARICQLLGRATDIKDHRWMDFLIFDMDDLRVPPGLSSMKDEKDHLLGTVIAEFKPNSCDLSSLGITAVAGLKGSRLDYRNHSSLHCNSGSRDQVLDRV